LPTCPDAQTAGGEKRHWMSWRGVADTKVTRCAMHRVTTHEVIEKLFKDHTRVVNSNSGFLFWKNVLTALISQDNSLHPGILNVIMVVF